MTRTASLARTAALAAALGAALPLSAHAQFTLTFEGATVPSNPPGPSVTDAASSLAAAYGGSDSDPTATVGGVVFDNRNAAAGGGFTVFRNTYTNNNAGGTDLYGQTRGALALTNAVNPIGAFASPPDTGPGDPGPDGLVFTTPALLQSLFVGSVDYGDAETGAGQVTITAFGAGGDLAHDTAALDTSGLTLSLLSTANFAPFAGQITGYRVNRTLGQDGTFNAGGNYVLDDLTFLTPSPEPSQWAGLGIGMLGLAGLTLRAKRRAA